MLIGQVAAGQRGTNQGAVHVSSHATSGHVLLRGSHLSWLSPANYLFTWAYYEVLDHFTANTKILRSSLL
jgi:hypothetical protein